MCLLAICMSSLEKYVFKSSASLFFFFFLIGLFAFFDVQPHELFLNFGG